MRGRHLPRGSRSQVGGRVFSFRSLSSMRGTVVSPRSDHLTSRPRCGWRRDAATRKGSDRPRHPPGVRHEASSKGRRNLPAGCVRVELEFDVPRRMPGKPIPLGQNAGRLTGSSRSTARRGLRYRDWFSRAGCMYGPSMASISAWTAPRRTTAPEPFARSRPHRYFFCRGDVFRGVRGLVLRESGFLTMPRIHPATACCSICEALLRLVVCIAWQSRPVLRNAAPRERRAGADGAPWGAPFGPPRVVPVRWNRGRRQFAPPGGNSSSR